MSFKSPRLCGKPQTTGKPVEGIGILVCHPPTYHMSVGSPWLRGKPKTTGKPVEGVVQMCSLHLYRATGLLLVKCYDSKMVKVSVV